MKKVEDRWVRKLCFGSDSLFYVSVAIGIQEIGAAVND